MSTKIYDAVGNLNVRQYVFVLFLLINAQDVHPKLLNSTFHLAYIHLQGKELLVVFSIGDLARFWLYHLGPLVYLIRKTFIRCGFSIS